MSTLFEKIINREIPSEILHENETCLVIKDVSPQAPFHALVIPKKPIPRIQKAANEDQSLLGHLLLTAAQVAQLEGVHRRPQGLVNQAGADIFGKAKSQLLNFLQVFLLD